MKKRNFITQIFRLVMVMSIISFIVMASLTIWFIIPDTVGTVYYCVLPNLALLVMIQCIYRYIGLKSRNINSNTDKYKENTNNKKQP